MKRGQREGKTRNKRATGREPNPGLAARDLSPLHMGRLLNKPSLLSLLLASCTLDLSPVIMTRGKIVPLVFNVPLDKEPWGL